ncbi:multidrug effflux MFS transporter [Propionivibrio dicarboxylicus]|uniref:Bcr/CflA family efflux transporter n=1 Tax=Propionivibrio dicarboxylicus TaxID=83767 RepID=A0A1G7VPJ3_9RHOO|nr:multidrug effflux MFS transporter [Propionivibrio dicarboxylicus]SDG61501.1 MFS transporter, DHA1 family, bicyclomycin/chloramphenicol resistance protein [Propionivibrio dicarboxylicus]
MTPPAAGRSTAGIAVLLAALAAVGSFSVDAYLPSLHDIGDAFRASPIEVQQTLTAYLFMFSLMSLWHGAISDAIGRRHVILFSLVVFVLASVGCLFATRIEHLWLLRGMQGFSACAGVVVSRAIVRDIFVGPAAQRLMSHITMMFAIAPAVAPVIGGQLQSTFGWRSIFIFLALMGGALWAACVWRLPETLPLAQRRSLHPIYLAKAYAKTLTSPAFLLATCALACNFGGFFIYIMSAPAFLIRHLGVPETGFLWLFGPAMCGLVCGAWLSGRLAGHLSPKRTIALGYAIMAFAVSINLGISFLLAPGLPWSVLPMPFYTLGMSLTMPSMSLLALDMFPKQRGLAASCQMFLQSLSNSLVAGIAAPAAWSSTHSLAAAMGAFMTVGALCAFLHFRCAHAPER